MSTSTTCRSSTTCRRAASRGRSATARYQGNLGNYAWPNRDDIDNPLAPDWWRERHARDPQGIEPLTDPRTGQQVPSPGYNPNRFFGIDATTLDPTWYHQEGFVMGGDWESQHPLQTRSIAGDCIDLDTENQTVHDYLIDAINRYLDMGVDALRIDTVKHIERGNLLEYVNAWKAHKPGPVRLRREPGQGHRLGRPVRRRQRALADPAVVVHPADQRSAQPQRRRQLRLLGARLRPVLDLPRQRQPRPLRRHRRRAVARLGLRRRHASSSSSCRTTTSAPTTTSASASAATTGWRRAPTTCCGRSAASPASTRARRSPSCAARRRTSSATTTRWTRPAAPTSATT